MFTTSSRAAMHAYRSVSVESIVESASPHELVLMLYDGALAALADARRHMAAREIAAKGQSISKAIAIIDSGLKASLDVKAGGELGLHLAALYGYMCDRLLRANLHNRIDIIDEVGKLLTELRGAWAQIKPVVHSDPGKASDGSPTHFKA